ncbi:MAG: hypothetical protein IJ944_03945 [Clostridia bacterium]|nr:hypothetical protein [Clostridia bacterium]
MSDSTNLSTLDLEELFEKLDKLLDILNASDESNILDNLTRFDEVYFELASRRLVGKPFDLLAETDKKKETVLERFENEINRKIVENMSACEKADIGTEEGKKRYFELSSQWSELSKFQSQLLHYRISSIKNSFEITKELNRELKDSGVLDALRRGEFSTEIVDE